MGEPPQVDSNGRAWVRCMGRTESPDSDEEGRSEDEMIQRLQAAKKEQEGLVTRGGIRLPQPPGRGNINMNMNSNSNSNTPPHLRPRCLCVGEGVGQRRDGGGKLMTAATTGPTNNLAPGGAAETCRMRMESPSGGAGGAPILRPTCVVASAASTTSTGAATGATGAIGGGRVGGASLASSSPPNCVDEAGQSPLFDPQHGAWWSRCQLPACECFPAFSCEWKLGWEAPYCPVATAHCLSSGRSPVQQVSRRVF